MGRAAKDVVPYFPHPVNGASRVCDKVMLRRYGGDGFTVLNILRETLGGTEGHYLDLSDSDMYVNFAADCYVSESNLREVIDFLAGKGWIDPVLWRDHKIIWMQEFVDSLAAVYLKRDRPLPEKPRLETGNANEVESDDSGGDNAVTGAGRGVSGAGRGVSGAGNQQVIVKGSNSNKLTRMGGCKGGSDRARSPGGASSTNAEKYADRVGKYFAGMDPGNREYDRLMVDFEALADVMDDEMAMARDWLLGHNTKSKRRGGMGGDFGPWLRRVWMPRSASEARKELKIPEGVPTVAEFKTAVKMYVNSFDGHRYGPVISNEWSKLTFDVTFGGVDRYNATGANYLDYALEKAWREAVELTNTKRKKV